MKVVRTGGPLGVIPTKHELPWPVGFTRDLSDADAAYLVGTFPDCFCVESESSRTAHVVSPESPSTDRAVRAPKKPKMTLASKAKAAVRKKKKTK